MASRVEHLRRLEKQRSFERKIQRLAVQHLNAIAALKAERASSLPQGWATLGATVVDTKPRFNHAAKCFVCKGTGVKQCPFNPEDIKPCECTH
jgi:hypothetical protein